MEEVHGAQDPPPDDRRDASRRRVMIAATILCPDGHEIACVLRDMSATGAKIAVARRHRLPEVFTLVVPGREGRYPVRRRWRRGDAAGILLDLTRPEGAPP